MDNGSFAIANAAAVGFGELSPRYFRLKDAVGSLAGQRFTQ